MTSDPCATVAEPPLWRATVPVFDAALFRLDRTVAKAIAAFGPEADAVFATRPAPGMLPAGQQVATAAQFTLRVAKAASASDPNAAMALATVRSRRKSAASKTGTVARHSGGSATVAQGSLVMVAPSGETGRELR